MGLHINQVFYKKTLFIAVYLLSTNVQAAFLEGNFTGTVSDIFDTINILPSTISVGDNVTGRFIVNLDAENLTPGEPFGLYSFTSRTEGISILIDEFSLISAVGLGGLAVFDNSAILTGQQTNFDLLSVRGTGAPSTFSIFPATQNGFADLSFELLDVDQLLLSDTSIPISLDLSQVDGGGGRIRFNEDGIPSTPQIDSTDAVIIYSFNSITLNITSTPNPNPIPIPATFWLFGTAILCFVAYLKKI